MRNIRVLYVSFVCGIKDNQCIVLYGIVDPFFEFTFTQYGSSRIVGVAEVNNVNALLGNFWDKIILYTAGHVHHITPFAVFFQCTGSST